MAPSTDQLAMWQPRTDVQRVMELVLDHPLSTLDELVLRQRCAFGEPWMPRESIRRAACAARDRGWLAALAPVGVRFPTPTQDLWSLTASGLLVVGERAGAA